MTRTEESPLIRFWRDEVEPSLNASNVYGVSKQRARARMPCPIHQGKGANFSVNADTLAWFCHSQCQEGGGPIEFVQKHLRLTTFREAVMALADMAGVSTYELERAERERGSSHSSPRMRVPRTTVPRVPDPPRYPPVSEVAALWNACERVDANHEVREWLKSECIDPIAVAGLDMARALSPGIELPAWAALAGRPIAAKYPTTCGGCAVGIAAGDEMHWAPGCSARCVSCGPERTRTWAETGHLLIAPMFDVDGTMRSLAARRVVQGDDSVAKSLAPDGGHLISYQRKGLVFACAMARQVLTSGQAPDRMPLRVEVAEGEKKWLLRATLAIGAAPAVACIGIESGSWNEVHASRVPVGAVVFIATDPDPTGAKYATQIVRSLEARIRARTVQVGLIAEHELHADEHGQIAVRVKE